MAKIIKFPLKLADGFGARTLDELRDHADVSSIATYYDNGKLHRWLLANYLDDNAKAIDSIKESLKSDYNKINTQKVKKVYEVLGISKVDEKELSDYLTNSNSAFTEASSNYDFEIENDVSMKSEVIKHIHPDTKIDDWDIACSETDTSGIFQVFIENKEENIFSSFNLKKDSFFYIKIANVIYNLSISLLNEQVKDLKQYALLKSEINSIFENPVGSLAMFGKTNWRIIKKNMKEALLLCSESVTSQEYEKVQDFLENSFINNVFSIEEKEALVPLSNSSFNLKMTEIQYDALYKKNDQKVFLFARDDINNLVDLEYKQCDVDWWLVDGFVKDTGGVVPMKSSDIKGAISLLTVPLGIVHMKSSDIKGVRPAIVITRQ